QKESSVRMELGFGRFLTLRKMNVFSKNSLQEQKSISKMTVFLMGIASENRPDTLTGSQKTA
ncbi:MAG: hypothetical protein LIO96_12620, partial [Lachnospiraceae bacterium]|nr:hypothetical protein [Lachnospiraceae bacterium]